MALLDSEGFGLSLTWADYLTYGLFQYVVGSPTGVAPVVLSGGMYGDNYAQISNSDASVQRTLPSAVSTFFFGARTRLNGAVSGSGYVFNDSLFNNQFGVMFDPNGSISVARGMAMSVSGHYSGGTVIGATAALVMPVNGWQYVEIGGLISATVGTVTIRVNGVSVLALTGLNTKGSAVSGTVQRVGFQPRLGTSALFNTQHWYLCDDSGAAPWNTFLGDVRVQTLLPTADDAVQFTHTGLATNWQNAANVPPVPFTDYNADATVGHQDTFAMAQLASDLGVIYGVHNKPLMFKSDPGARSGAAVLKSGGTTATGTTVVLSETAAQLRTMYQTDPDTTAQWLAAAVNVIKAGYKVAA